MHVVSRAGERPESVQALFSAIDSCSYPSISVDDLSSSSSGEERKAPRGKPAARDEEKCLSPSEFVCPSPVMSPESQEDGSERTEVETQPAASPRSTDAERTEGRDPALDSDSGEACSSRAADHQSERSPGVNGRHRTAAPESESARIPSESDEETGEAPGDSGAQRGAPSNQKASALSALKRTHAASEEGDSASSPSEKKLKT